LLITPQLRALNRISPFIAFFAILASVTIVCSLLSRYRARWIHGAIALFVIAVCVFDQVAAGGARWGAYYAEITRQFDRDGRFFHGLEKRLPAGSMLLQLPLMPYPEEPPKAKLASYDLSTAYLHTKTLRWTFGAMRGRPEELWQRQIGAFPLAKQIAALRTLGFSGIVVDRRGYDDRAAAVDGALAQAGLAHDAANDDDIHEFYPLPGIGKAADRSLAVAPARGWFDIRATTGGAAVSSAGEASLLIGNIGSEKRYCRLELTLETVGIQRRVGLWDGTKKISEQTLMPGEPNLFAMDIDVAGGARRIDLRTDAPAVSTGAKPAAAFNWVMSEVPLCR
jgi:phosphoglycerol transferase